jgi:sugar (pentulose or hexulose) kinase
MKPRPCYPFFNLYEYLKNNKHDEVKVITLPDWIASLDGQSRNLSHVTMSAGLGFYNIYNKCFDNNLTGILKKQYNTRLLFNTVTETVQISGYIKYENKDIPIYTGVGDHQCAVLGAGNTEETISLNLGTGSQVGLINSKSNTAEKRPYFNGKLMSVLTHIPSGRAFNTYIGFLSEINPNIDYWKLLSEINVDNLIKSSLNIDLAVFSSAWNYNIFKGISGINENNFTLKNFLSSLIYSYIKQFENAIEYIGDKRDKIVLSGGISEKLPVIRSYFAQKYDICPHETKIDETFLGLCIIIDNVIYKESV